MHKPLHNHVNMYAFQLYVPCHTQPLSYLCIPASHLSQKMLPLHYIYPEYPELPVYYLMVRHPMSDTRFSHRTVLSFRLKLPVALQNYYGQKLTRLYHQSLLPYPPSLLLSHFLSAQLGGSALSFSPSDYESSQPLLHFYLSE